ncbi:hypothetical protein ACQEUX_03720 [Micromonospora sp. CA-259024]|uniref:hypothetical protein n=1 Tax=Micromonospora sp. CA-259024 TaxID=3239965 RepID=UPI003D8EF819
MRREPWENQRTRRQAAAVSARIRGSSGRSGPFGDAPCQLPPPLLHAALDWLHAERGAADELSAVVLGRRASLTAEAADPATVAVLLTVGDAEQWLPDHPDALAVLARGRELLAGGLADEAQAWRMTADRICNATPSADC